MTPTDCVSGENGTLQAYCSLLTSCQSIVGLGDVESTRSERATCLHIFPNLISEHDLAQEFNPLPQDDGEPSQFLVWTFSLVCVTFINLIALLGACLVPLMSKGIYEYIMTMLIGLAVGALSGSSLIHLIPGAIGFGDDKRYLDVALYVVIGIYIFCIIERLLKYSVLLKERKCERKRQYFQELPSTSPSHLNAPHHCIQPPDSLTSYDCNSCIDSKSKMCDVDDQQIESVAWMIVLGDAMHNFMDGVTIGAAFQHSLVTGFSICVAVVGEELPHELGDFAAMINGGMTVRKALFFNFVSACTCYIGLIIGILVSSQAEEAFSVILGLAGGFFLYIALVDMMPIMTDTVDTMLKDGNPRKAVIAFFVQSIGLAIGVSTLYLLAKYDHVISLEGVIDL